MIKASIKALCSPWCFGALTNLRFKRKRFICRLDKLLHAQNYQQCCYKQMPVFHINTAIKNCLWIRERVQRLFLFCPKKKPQKTCESTEKSLPCLVAEPETNHLSVLSTFSETLQVLKGQCLQTCFWHVIKWNMSPSSESWEFPRSPGGVRFL